jgi:hypothetical protein
MLSAGDIRSRSHGLRLVSQILLAMQILSLGHLLLVRHVTCPEHGDIVHVEDSAAAEPDRFVVGMGAPLQHSMGATEPAAAAEHNHCLMCVDANRRCLLTSPAQTCTDRVLAVRVIRDVTTAFFAPVDLILLSPKNSPPSA